MVEPAARFPGVDLGVRDLDMAVLVVRRRDDTGDPATVMEQEVVTMVVVDLIMMVVVSESRSEGHVTRRS